MTKFKIIMHYPDGVDEEQDELFDTESEAINYAGYLVGCCRTGAETLFMSNPGDYPYDEDEFEEPDYSIIEISE